MRKDQYSLGGILIELDALLEQLKTAPTQGISSVDIRLVGAYLNLTITNLRVLLEEING